MTPTEICEKLRLEILDAENRGEVHDGVQLLRDSKTLIEQQERRIGELKRLALAVYWWDWHIDLGDADVDRLHAAIAQLETDLTADLTTNERTPSE